MYIAVRIYLSDERQPVCLRNEESSLTADVVGVWYSVGDPEVRHFIPWHRVHHIERQQIEEEEEVIAV